MAHSGDSSEVNGRLEATTGMMSVMAIYRQRRWGRDLAHNTGSPFRRSLPDAGMTLIQGRGILGQGKIFGAVKGRRDRPLRWFY